MYHYPCWMGPLSPRYSASSGCGWREGLAENVEQAVVVLNELWFWTLSIVWCLKKQT